MTVVIRAAGPDDAAAIAELEREALGRDAWSQNLVAQGVGGGIPTTYTDEPAKSVRGSLWQVARPPSAHPAHRRCSAR